MKGIMKKEWITRCLAIIVLLLPTKGFTNAYFIDSMDGKATGMADAFTAIADDPAAVYYNPAGMVQLDGTRISTGLTFVDIRDATFKSNGTSLFGTAGHTTDARPTQAYIPNLFMTHKVSDSLSLGMGMYSNIGLSTHWPDGWEGRYISGGTDAMIETITLNPAAAYRVHKKLSLSGGFVLQKAEVQLQNKYSVVVGETVYPDATMKLTADDQVSYGYNLAFLAWLTDDVKLGMSYRSAMRHDLDGTFKLYGTPGAAGDMKDDISTVITLPALLCTGIAYTKGPLALDFDIVYVQWSNIHDMKVDFDTLPDSDTPKKWNNTWNYRLGGSYNLTEAFALRTGVEYSQNPIPDSTVEPTTPTNDRWRLCLGGGYKTGNLTLDLAYNYIYWTSKRTYNNSTGDYGAAGQVTGEFNVPAHLIATTIGYKF